MFTMKIVDSDAFLDMPLSSQCLYFHLNMRADDDGFVNNPRRIQRMIGASDDDMKLLIAKRFLLVFESGVVVIKHWRMNNYLRKDRYTPTQYQEEFQRLCIKDDGAYTEAENSLSTVGIPTGIPDGNHLSTQDRLGKDRVVKDRLVSNYNDSKDYKLVNDDKNTEALQSNTKCNAPGNETGDAIICSASDEAECRASALRVGEAWNQIGVSPVQKFKLNSQRGRMLKARLREFGEETIIQAMDKVKQSPFLLGQNDRGWVITFDWFLKPNNFQKVMEGQYDERPGRTERKGQESTVDQMARLMREGAFRE